MEKLKDEAVLIMDYEYRKTKMEEFIVNYHNVSEHLTQSQFEMPGTVKRFLQFSNDLKVENENDAEAALEKLENFVRFSKQDRELIERLRNRKLEKRVDIILNSYDLRGKLGLLKREALKKQYWAEEERLVLITGGFGAEPNAIGKSIFVTFLSDYEETRFKRYDLECIFCDDINSLFTE